MFKKFVRGSIFCKWKDFKIKLTSCGDVRAGNRRDLKTKVWTAQSRRRCDQKQLAVPLLLRHNQVPFKAPEEQEVKGRSLRHLTGVSLLRGRSFLFHNLALFHRWIHHIK